MQSGDLLFAAEGIAQDAVDVGQVPRRQIVGQACPQLVQGDRLAEARRLVVDVEILDFGVAPAALEQQENLRGGLQELVGADPVVKVCRSRRLGSVGDAPAAGDDAAARRGQHAIDEIGILAAADCALAQRISDHNA